MNEELRATLEAVRSGALSVDEAALRLKKTPFEDLGYDDWATGEMIPAYGHASDQIIYNTAASMGRILEKKF